MKNNKKAIITVIVVGLLICFWLIGTAQEYKNKGNILQKSSNLGGIDFSLKIPSNLKRDIIVNDMIMYALSQISTSSDYSNSMTGRYLNSLGYDSYSDLVYSGNNYSEALEDLINHYKHNDAIFVMELENYNTELREKLDKPVKKYIYPQLSQIKEKIKLKCHGNKKCLDNSKKEMSDNFIRFMGIDNAIQGGNYEVQAKLREIPIQVDLRAIRY